MRNSKIISYRKQILILFALSWTRRIFLSIVNKQYAPAIKLLYGSIFFALIFSCCPAFSQLNPESQTDTLDKKQIRKQKRIEFKETAERNYIRLGFVRAHLDTELTFEFPDKYLMAKIGLEDDFGLPGKKTFTTGSYINRITPASGIYLNYYGINRTADRQTEREIIFKGDTIEEGLETTAYFNTQVISTGYLFSIKQDPGVFLGAFFNIYFMWLDTGIRSEVGDIDAKVRLVAPLPNIGVIFMFKLNSWLSLNGDVSFFTLHTTGFSGSLYSFSAKLLFKPAHWLAFDLSYQEFDIRVQWPYEEINTVVDYNFRGPALGVNFFF